MDLSDDDGLFFFVLCTTTATTVAIERVLTRRKNVFENCENMADLLKEHQIAKLAGNQ